jgi:pyruvate dehydrogenase E2 component (dihydrolipoamide acetyltransferase)
MPSLGADMEAGTLVEWLVKPGDQVKRGDIVAVVETQKGAIEIEIFDSGEIAQILVERGNKVPVGTPLARLRMAEAAAPAARAERPEAPPPAPRAAPVAEPPPSPPVAPVARPPKVGEEVAAARARISPAARRLAEQRGVDLAHITGSGPGGSIVLADVERALASAEVKAEGRRAIGLDLDAMRQAIAAAMARSKREIPHYYLSQQVDVTVCEEFLSRANATRPPDKRLLMTALFVKAVALAARRFPRLNGFFREGRFEPASSVHAGIAIAIRGGGLAAPAILDTDQLSLDALMERLRDLVQRTRAGRLRSSEIAQPTITISSLGDRGVAALYGIIYPPQVALVGVGTPIMQPWVVDGAIGARPIVTLTLSADHRVSDGHMGALLLSEIGRLLQEPEKL